VADFSIEVLGLSFYIPGLKPELAGLESRVDDQARSAAFKYSSGDKKL